MRIRPGMASQRQRRSSESSKLIGRATVRAGAARVQPSARGRLTPQTRPLGFSAMSDAAQKTTPLYDEHVRLGAKMIPFGGWLMPVQYTSIMDEHQAVRKPSASSIFRTWESWSRRARTRANGSTHADKQHRQTRSRQRPIHFSAQRRRRDHRRPDCLSDRSRRSFSWS